MSATSDLHQRLIAFALQTLETLSANLDDGANTVGILATDALDRDLGVLTSDGTFHRAPEVHDDIATYDFASPNFLIPDQPSGSLVALEIDIDHEDPLTAARDAWRYFSSIPDGPVATVLNHRTGQTVHVDLDTEEVIGSHEPFPEHLSGPHGCHPDCPACALELTPA